MERSQLEKAIQKGDIHGVYLLDGTEEYLKKQVLTVMQEKLFPDGMGEMNTTVFQTPDTDELMAACETLPFLSEKRLVIVEEETALQGKREADEALLDYFSRLPDSCVLVYACRGKADSRRKIVKKIDKIGTYVSFSPMSERECGTWIVETFSALGKKCSYDIAQELMFMAGNDAMLLKGEIEKLAALVGEREEIRHEDLQSVTTQTSEYRSWELVNAVIGGQEQQAFLMYHQMLRNGEEPMMILAMLSRQYRILQHVSILQYEEKPKSEMMRALNVQGFVLDRYLSQMRSLSGAVIRDSVRLCADTDLGIKSGFLSDEGAVEALMIQLFALRRAHQKKPA